jgi:hypothetical protein
MGYSQQIRYAIAPTQAYRDQSGPRLVMIITLLSLPGKSAFDAVAVMTQAVG